VLAGRRTGPFGSPVHHDSWMAPGEVNALRALGGGTSDIAPGRANVYDEEPARTVAAASRDTV
jgi:hypothetical protein